MAVLGGSPLGLIGVGSSPNRDGMSSFNAGDSRNVNIFYYNSGKEGDVEKQPKSGGMYSLFSNKSVIKPWPNIGKLGTDSDTSGLKDNADDKARTYKSIARNRLHNDEIYDTSLLNIIEKLSGTPAALRPADFAYTKNIGVFPNNRLMIARRFAGPVNDNIYRKSKEGGQSRPLALLVSWKPQDEDFLEFEFGEKWEEAKADFTGILTQVGEDFMGKGLGAKAGGAGGMLPLPGFTEQLQRRVLERLGILEKGASEDHLPSGNPNLIKEAKKRTTVSPGEPGSGLTCNISIKMTCEYEQKFISGLDPTVVWQDLLSTILNFGSSNSADYGLSSNASKTLISWVNNPKLLITSLSESIKNSLTDIVDGFKESIVDDYDEQIKNADKTTKEKKEEISPAQQLKQKKEAAINMLSGFGDITADVIEKTIGKYKEEVKGIVFALSGLPSTPWHITIGNPLRPIFSSGDMLTTSVNVKLGSDLAFNDLPSRITVDFTLKNARPLGIQEIMKKFNTGYLRTIDTAADWSGNKPDQKPGDLAYGSDEKEKTENELNNADSGSGISNSISMSKKTEIKTSENSEMEVINSDANSLDSPVIKDGNTIT